MSNEPECKGCWLTESGNAVTSYQMFSITKASTGGGVVGKVKVYFQPLHGKCGFIGEECTPGNPCGLQNLKCELEPGDAPDPLGAGFGMFVDAGLTGQPTEQSWFSTLPGQNASGPIPAPGESGGNQMIQCANGEERTYKFTLSYYDHGLRRMVQWVWMELKYKCGECKGS